MQTFFSLIPLLSGWLADKIFGDPGGWPHPVVGFGRWIAFWDKRINCGRHRKRNGALLAAGSIAGTFGLTVLLLHLLAYLFLWIQTMLLDQGFLSSGTQFLAPLLLALCTGVFVFYGLAGTTLVREVREVFRATDRSVEEGRRQVARIVGRNTENLSEQEIRTAILE